MDQEKIDGIVRKIKGLLAVADGQANEDESQAAFVLAQKLMLKYNISQAEINDGEDVNVVAGQASTHKTLRWYERFIVSLVSENFRVKAYYNGRKKNGRRQDAVVFYGLDGDVSLAKEVYILMVDALEHYTKRYIEIHYEQTELSRTRKYTSELKNSYMSGFISALKDKLDEQRQELAQEYGLMVLMPKIVEEKYNELSKSFGQAKNIRIPSVDEAEAYMQGRKDGSEVDYTRSSIEEGI